MRVLSNEKRKFYRPAAEEWATTHGKLVLHPVFYEWVADPVAVASQQ